MRVKRPTKKGIILSLCLSDLKHEWLLTLCMVMAVASVLGPLLIFFGLKFGTIETMRERLLNDPRNCEMRPLSVRSYDPEWFQQIAARPDVTFIIPYTRQLSATVDAYLPGQENKVMSLDIVPTAPDDPLLLQNDRTIPELYECLLSQPAAENLGAKVGDTLVLVARRVKGGGFETGEVQVKIIGVMPIRAGALKSVFLRLPLLEAVENYKDGMAVPSLNWGGELPRAYPVFTSLLLACPQSLGPEQAFKTTLNTGFSNLSEVSLQQAQALCAAELDDSHTYYLLQTRGNPATANNIKALEYGMRGYDVKLYPLNQGLTVSLHNQYGEVVTEDISIMPAAPLYKVEQDIAPTIPRGSGWQDSLDNILVDTSTWRQLLVPAQLIPDKQENLTLHMHIEERSLSFPVKALAIDTTNVDTAYAPLHLVGVLGLFENRPLVWDESSNEFLLSRRGYAGFRLYASSLETVAPLQKYIEEQGLQVNTAAVRIDEVVSMDTYLSLIFWLIALGSIIGGAACLIANIYAGIERKRQQLAVLRLLGIGGGAFVRFPLYTASFFAISGVVVALLLYSGVASLINTLFASHLAEGENICRLTWWHALAAFGLTWAVALLAGAIAARKAISIDPAEALRND